MKRFILSLVVVLGFAAAPAMADEHITVQTPYAYATAAAQKNGYRNGSLTTLQRPAPFNPNQPTAGLSSNHAPHGATRLKLILHKPPIGPLPQTP